MNPKLESMISMYLVNQYFFNTTRMHLNKTISSKSTRLNGFIQIGPQGPPELILEDSSKNSLCASLRSVCEGYHECSQL